MDLHSLKFTKTPLPKLDTIVRKLEFVKQNTLNIILQYNNNPKDNYLYEIIV